MSGIASTRRDIFAAAGLGLGLAALAGGAEAAARGLSDTEKTNLKVVNDFCAAFPTSDPAKLIGYFSDNPAYRVNEVTPPAVGHDAVLERMNGLARVVSKFEVHESWVRGPMVINERTDYFNGGRLKTWRGVGVFFVQNGKIVEWYDYTIERVLA